MDELRSAVRLLIDAGIIVQPDALDVLKSSHNPSKLVQDFLKRNNELDTVSSTDFIQTNQKRDKDKSEIANIGSTSRVPRRTIRSKKHLTNHITSIDQRIEKRIPDQRTDLKKTKLKVSQYNISKKTIIQTSLDDLKGLNNYESELKIIKDPELSKNLSGRIEDLVGYFQDRYVKLAKIFRKRRDISNLTKIKDIKRNEGQISIIGMLTDKSFPSTGGGYLELEDPTSDRIVQVILPKSNPTLVEECVHIMTDSVICIVGYLKNDNLIANEVLLPDIPSLWNRNRADIPVHAAFLSDIHVGSKNFLTKPMEKFIKFLNGELGNSKIQALGNQTKYVLFGGDVVDGVGIYPNQLDDLQIDSIHDQYDAFATFVDRIPNDIEIVIIPGNHDMVRAAEPQPKILPEYAPSLDGYDNVHMLPNPTQVALHNVEVLMYHCTSLPDVMNHIPGLPVDKPVDVMKHMLKARHLAPIWGAKTPIAAEPEDHLVIDHIPDIFHGGHIHINGEGHYKGVQIINSGTMQKQTSYQKSLNIIPTPGQVTLTNLKTLKYSRLDLMGEN